MEVCEEENALMCTFKYPSVFLSIICPSPPPSLSPIDNSRPLCLRPSLFLSLSTVCPTLLFVNPFPSSSYSCWPTFFFFFFLLLILLLQLSLFLTILLSPSFSSYSSNTSLQKKKPTRPMVHVTNLHNWLICVSCSLLDSNICRRCPENCRRCSNSNICTECKPGLR